MKINVDLKSIICYNKEVGVNIMENVMRKTELLKILNKIPQAERNLNGLYTRKQLMRHMSYIPTWLNDCKTTKFIGSKSCVFYDLSTDDSLKTTQETQGAEANIPMNTKPTTINNNLIPLRDPAYVAFGNYKDLEQIVSKDIFYPVYVSGPTGNGKSSMVEQICAKHKKPLIRININSLSDEEQLIGSKTLVDGNIEIVEGPVLIAMRNGYTLLLDECDAGSANTLLCLQGIIEGRPFYFKLKNEVIEPKTGFNIIATANTKGKGSDDGRYVGTNVLNEAFLERFAVTFEQKYPEPKVETKIIEAMMSQHNCFNQKFADNLIKWVTVIRKTFEDGALDENITTRRLGHIVRAYAIFKDEKKAITLCCNRFDTVTQEAFLKVFENISGHGDGDVVVDDDNTKKIPEQMEVPF